MKTKVLVYHSNPREQELILNDLPLSSGAYDVAVAGTPAVAQMVCAAFDPHVVVIGEPLFPGGFEMVKRLRNAHQLLGDAFPMPVLIAYQPIPKKDHQPEMFDLQKAAELFGFFRIIPRRDSQSLHSTINRARLVMNQAQAT